MTELIAKAINALPAQEADNLRRMLLFRERNQRETAALMNDLAALGVVEK